MRHHARLIQLFYDLRSHPNLFRNCQPEAISTAAVEAKSKDQASPEKQDDCLAGAGAPVDPSLAPGRQHPNRPLPYSSTVPSNPGAQKTSQIERSLPGSAPSEVKGMCPLTVVGGGEFGVQSAHRPFTLAELKETKRDLGSYTTDPDQYTQTFKLLTSLYDLTWRDVKLILDQTLTSLERDRVYKMAREVGTDYYNSHSPSERADKMIPTGAQAVPSDDPMWDPNLREDSERAHFLYCIIEGLKKAKVKPV